ncbi:MAG: hypothetical protein KDI62_16070 [Anaerolineae bacterium]|nr:hypothetical protein [Anaerolineae bacterium]MCB9079980.1 hypothetical protein [Anaerolineaceae bacterium]
MILLDEKVTANIPKEQLIPNSASTFPYRHLPILFLYYTQEELNEIVPRGLWANFIVTSSAINFPPPDIANETIITAEEVHSKVLSHKEAYKLALATLQTFEDEWNKYLDEEARDLSVFEEEDE